MNNVYKFFSYNYFKIIRDNFNNNSETKETKRLEKLAIIKEVTGIVFVILNFLSTYIGLSDIYQLSYKRNVLFYILKDNFFTCVVWFIILSVLPIITNYLNKKNIKSKYYLILLVIYLLSNLYNLIMIIYFISTFINGPIVGILGIINIIVTIVVNMNVVVEIIEIKLKRNS